MSAPASASHPDLALQHSAGIGRLLVIFAGAGARVMGQGRVEFFATVRQTGRPWIVLTDRSQGFFGDPSLADAAERAIRAAMADSGSQTVDTIGHSMGGFAALAFAQRLPVARAISFSPRFSPDPAIVPDRRMRSRLRQRSGRFAFPSVARGLNAVGQALIIHGTIGNDLPHVVRFPQAPNIAHWLMRGVRHDVPQRFKAAGSLGDLIAAALSDDQPRLTAILRASNAAPRAELADAIRRPLFTARLVARFVPEWAGFRHRAAPARPVPERNLP